jgi:hypothetical protein
VNPARAFARAGILEGRFELVFRETEEVADDEKTVGEVRLEEFAEAGGGVCLPYGQS